MVDIRWGSFFIDTLLQVVGVAYVSGVLGEHILILKWFLVQFPLLLEWQVHRNSWKDGWSASGWRVGDGPLILSSRRAG